MRKLIDILRENVEEEAVIERAAKALERHNKSAYGWSDDLFEIWWNRDKDFVERVHTWGNFQGTEKEKLFHEVKIVLDAARGDQ